MGIMRITLPTGTTAALAPCDDPRGGLVVIPDIMGLRPLFDEMVERLAREWRRTVCAPDLYPGRTDLDLEGRLSAARDLDDDEVLADVVAAADACGVEPVAVIGFCMGGMYALKAVGTGRFCAHVPFYGMIRVPASWAGPGQADPLAAVRAGDPTSVLAIIGTDDDYTPPGDVDELEATGAEVVRYEGAGHGFVHDPDRPAHRPDDARDAWARAEAFVERRCGGERGSSRGS